MGHKQLLGQGLGEIAFVSKKFANEAFGQLGNRMPIIDIARDEAIGQNLALVINKQVQLEAEEQAHRGLATGGSSRKDTMLVDAGVVADGKGGGVDEANARATVQFCVQIGHEGNEHDGHQLDKTRIADQRRKLAV